MRQLTRFACHAVFAVCAVLTAPAATNISRFTTFEKDLEATGEYSNPYRDLEAEAILKSPDDSQRRLPLFWDGGKIWKLRVSPDRLGEWSFAVRSRDQGLNEQTGRFTCVASTNRGSLEPMRGFPHHFQYQNGEAMWFMGDTAWALFTDDPKEKHDRPAIEKYLKTRAAQGFNVVHSMVLSEAGWGNSGGLPFGDLSKEQLNPGYWREVDERVAIANRHGIVVGLAIAWGDKRKREPFAWRKFPDLEARKRYARYMAARYGAYNVYFIVSGEWHGEVRTRPGPEPEIKREFIEIGNALNAADAHGRMKAIHPMTSHGSVREFNDANWMSFGDYQQNYHDLHSRVLESRRFNKPVVNSEYAYHLRDQSGDGVPDKDNSTSLESMRHATWDIVMAGGYIVTGFGTTYFGGHRDPGPFDLDASKNDDWERQINLLKNFFTGLEYWKLEPHDDLLECSEPRGKDGRELNRLAPPARTYWCLAEPGRQFLVYGRGVSEPVKLRVEDGNWRLHEFNPRTGQMREKQVQSGSGVFAYEPPTQEDWVFLLRPAE